MKGFLHSNNLISGHNVLDYTIEHIVVHIMFNIRVIKSEFPVNWDTHVQYITPVTRIV
ncbi:hypothetical protein C0J52_01901 [Blattella germanica]|nr:hypothetical protein C0J52_01901 [Blattella germanica]